MTDPIAVALVVSAALESSGIPYSIGGSLASSFSGEPRASIDVDIVVDMSSDHVEPFVNALGDEFYVDSAALRRAIGNRSSTNVVHRASGIKADLFVAGSFRIS